MDKLLGFQHLLCWHMQKEMLFVLQAWALCNWQVCEWDSSFSLFTGKCGGNRHTHSSLWFSAGKIKQVHPQTLRSAFFVFSLHCVGMNHPICRHVPSIQPPKTKQTPLSVAQISVFSTSYNCHHLNDDYKLHSEVRIEAVGHDSLWLFCEAFKSVLVM